MSVHYIGCCKATPFLCHFEFIHHCMRVCPIKKSNRTMCVCPIKKSNRTMCVCRPRGGVPVTRYMNTIKYTSILSLRSSVYPDSGFTSLCIGRVRFRNAMASRAFESERACVVVRSFSNVCRFAGVNGNVYPSSKWSITFFMSSAGGKNNPRRGGVLGHKKKKKKYDCVGPEEWRVKRNKVKKKRNAMVN